MDRGAEETDMRDLRLQTQPTCGTTGMVSRCGIPPSCGKGGMWENGARFIGGDAGFPKEMRMPPIAVPLLPADGQWKGNGAIFPSSRTERPSRKEIGEIGENRPYPPVPVSKEHPAETIRLRSRKRGKEMTSTGPPAKSHDKRTTAKSKRKWGEQTGAAIPLRSPREKIIRFPVSNVHFSGIMRGILRAAGGHAEEMPSGAIFPNLFRRQFLRSISRDSVPSLSGATKGQSRVRRSCSTSGPMRGKH